MSQRNSNYGHSSHFQHKKVVNKWKIVTITSQKNITKFVRKLSRVHVYWNYKPQVFEFVEAVIIIVMAKCHCQSCPLSKFVVNKKPRDEITLRWRETLSITSVLLLFSCVWTSTQINLIINWIFMLTELWAS